MARYLNLVDPAAFDDRRNHEPIIYAQDTEAAPEVYVTGDSYGIEAALPEFPDLPSFSVYGYRSVQRYHLEVWCEKTTMDDVLRPICERYGANLIRGVGELSITATLELVKRLAQRGKPARIFYISDFDPAGKSMPVAVARKTEYFVHKLGLDSNRADVRLFPIMLTEEQVQQYQLPRTPIKESEKRKDRFEKIYGTGATELDALEALFPGELGRILSQQLDSYYDRDLDNQVRAVRDRLARELVNRQSEVYDRYDSEIGELRGTYARLQAEFESRMAAHNARVSQLWQTISRELEENTPDLEDFPVPEANQSEEIGPGLYNSNRSYLEQIQAYKGFQGKNSFELEESGVA